jgi:hypothetical protein
MKEWIVDLFPKGGGIQTKTRVFASNQAAAIKLAKGLYPNHRTGAVKPANQ